MANSKEPYILLTLYQNLYKDKYNKAVTINKFREKWAMQDVIDSVGSVSYTHLTLPTKRIV